MERVVDESPMSSGQRATFLALTVVAIGAVSAFLIFVPWYHPENPSLARVVFIPLMLFHFGCWLVRWLALWRMRRPMPMQPQEGMHVAAITAFVPGAEPLGMLEQTVRAIVAMNYPHDTWVLDEGDDPKAAELRRRRTDSTPCTRWRVTLRDILSSSAVTTRTALPRCGPSAACSRMTLRT